MSRTTHSEESHARRGFRGWIRAGLGIGLLMGATDTACGQAPHDLRVGEGFDHPLGFHDATPKLSWKLPADRPGSQTAYQILAASDPSRLPGSPDLWDSGKVESDRSVYVPYTGAPLASRGTVYWEVRYWDEQNQPSPWSRPARFELGLLANADWQGQWIHLPFPEQGDIAGAPVKITVDRAMYGVPDDEARQLDVTDQVRDRLEAGTFQLRAENALAGTDPAYGVVKALILTYRRNGESLTRTLEEGTTLNLRTGRAPEERMQFVPEYLRKEFELGEGIDRARLYVTARGVFVAYLNGRKVGHDHFSPGWTPYEKRIETVTYDVTDLLRAGGNVLGVLLGEGWYAGYLMGKPNVYPEMQPQVLVQLEVKTTDGHTVRVMSDTSWKGTREGPIRFSGIYDGEIYDARKEMPGWNASGFDATDWVPAVARDIDPDVRLVPKRHFPVRVTGEQVTSAITEPAPGRFVFDLGQNLVGWPRLRIPVTEGATVTVRVAEMLQQDGTLYTDNYRGAKSMDTYTAAKTGIATWHPTFTFHGFRYVELSGLPEGARPEREWVSGMVLHSVSRVTGSFQSSHDQLNQLQRNITWGLRGNFLDVPTDCPQRDERLGWTGDAQVFAPTSLFNRDVHAFWMSWLESMRDDQHPDGAVPNVVPNTLRDHCGGPGWADAATVIPWELYVRTGDRDVLEENFDLMRRWVGWYESQARDHIVDVTAYGDWLQPYPQGAGNSGDTPRTLIGTAYFAHSAALAARAAQVLGNSIEAARLKALAKRVRDAFIGAFFDETGTLTTDHETQTGYLLALGFDLLPEAIRTSAAHNLVRLVGDADGHLRTGFLGTPLLAPVLDRYGRTDLAYGALFTSTYPSWFFSIDQGATTMWERWNSFSHADGFGDAGMNSFNHYAYGAIGQWMVERIAGLAPDADHPGYKHFFIQPIPGGPLTHAAADYESRYGTARSAWTLRDDGLDLAVTIPPNTTATVVFPAGTPAQIQADGAPLIRHPKLLRNGTDTRGRTTATFAPGTYSMTVATMPE